MIAGSPRSLWQRAGLLEDYSDDPAARPESRAA
jgi:hypothetical protein